MPLILALDTTGEHGSLALLRSAYDRPPGLSSTPANSPVLLEQRPLHAPDGYGHMLYAEIAAILERHAVRLADVDCFAAASGPGTFTGVRVALACIKGLAEAQQRPAVAVSNLEAIAWHGSAHLRAVAIDARRGDVYGAVYDAAGHPAAEEVVAKPAAWLTSLPAGVGEFLVHNVSLDLSSTRFADVPVSAAPLALAHAIAAIAAGRLARGEACDPAALDANYIRRSDAELALKM